MWLVLGNALLIFLLRVVDVTMRTIRVIIVTRGHRYLAALIGFFEVSIWVVAISRVIDNIDSVWSVLGYGGGFAAGTLLGAWVEDKLALGNVYIHVVSLSKGQEIAHRIRQAGCGATELRAEGQSGPVHLVRVVAPRRRAKRIIQLVDEVDATSFVTVEDARQVKRGYLRVMK